MACLIAFLSAAGTDVVLAKWVTAVAAREALKASILSMIMAMLLLSGVNEALHDSLAAVFWVLGYGAGSFIAVRWQGAKAKTT